MNMTNAVDVVTSPQDDSIEKAAYLERCFPTASRFVATDVRHPVEVEQELVLWLCGYELEDGSRFRNAEAITVQDDQVVDILG
jgi:hypothetical protein